MKRLTLFLAFIATIWMAYSQEVRYLTTEEFKEKVFDYAQAEEWCYKGELPCVIDFYATWCGPCKQYAPIMAELAKDYAGKVNFYKVDVDKEKELAYYFGVRSIPTTLFCPMTGKPQIAQGAMPRAAIEPVIKQMSAK